MRHLSRPLTHANVMATIAVVSNPPNDTVAAVVSASAVGPVRIRQLVTVVAPFQLTATRV